MLVRLINFKSKNATFGSVKVLFGPRLSPCVLLGLSTLVSHEENQVLCRSGNDTVAKLRHIFNWQRCLGQTMDAAAGGK